MWSLFKTDPPRAQDPPRVLDLTLDEMLAMRGRGRGSTSLNPIEGRYPGDLRARRRGIGMELDSVGPYQAGDDVRHIEWLATARTGRPQVKRFRAELQWTMMLLLDLRSSMFFGSRQQLMAKTACLAAAKLAFDLSPYHQRLGWVCLTDDGPQTLQPRRGRRARLQQLNQVVAIYSRLQPLQGDRGTALDRALEGVSEVVRGDARVVLLSDFSFPGEQADNRLRELARQGLRAIVIEDATMNQGLPSGTYPLRAAGMAGLRTASIGRIDDRAQSRQIRQMRQELRGWLADLGIRQVQRCDPETLAQRSFR